MKVDDNYIVYIRKEPPVYRYEAIYYLITKRGDIIRVQKDGTREFTKFEDRSGIPRIEGDKRYEKITLEELVLRI